MNCYELLIRLGVTPNYVGFRQTQSAVELVQRQPDLLFLVTKQVYPLVAKEYNTSWKAVERNIRSIIAIAWDRNPELLQKLAGYPLTAKPTASQFIAILAYQKISSLFRV